jgi:hypothetical protein
MRKSGPLSATAFPRTEAHGGACTTESGGHLVHSFEPFFDSLSRVDGGQSESSYKQRCDVVGRGLHQSLGFGSASEVDLRVQVGADW